MKLTFVRFAYQVLVEGSLVIVLDDFDMAKQFAADTYKNIGAVILPVPIFKYEALSTI